jgi:hypothetical protein
MNKEKMGLNPTQATFESYDYAIGGKMVVGSVRIHDSLIHNVIDAKNKLKQDLVQQMANYMLENKLVEFTKVYDPSTDGEIIHVRAYLAPNDEVRILRLSARVT